jgi:hypothetical protein
MMVNYITRITVQLSNGQHALFKNTNAGYVKQLPLKEKEHDTANIGRNIYLLRVLEQKGFAFKTGKDCVYAVSAEIEAQDAKEFLLAQGFHDNEFQVFLEYTRKWGTM